MHFRVSGDSLEVGRFTVRPKGADCWELWQSSNLLREGQAYMSAELIWTPDGGMVYGRVVSWLSCLVVVPSKESYLPVVSLEPWDVAILWAEMSLEQRQAFAKGLKPVQRDTVCYELTDVKAVFPSAIRGAQLLIRSVVFPGRQVGIVQ